VAGEGWARPPGSVALAVPVCETEGGHGGNCGRGDHQMGARKFLPRVPSALAFSDRARFGRTAGANRGASLGQTGITFQPYEVNS
jgi:hypothetical protein